MDVTFWQHVEAADPTAQMEMRLSEFLALQAGGGQRGSPVERSFPTCLSTSLKDQMNGQRHVRVGQMEGGMV